MSAVESRLATGRRFAVSGCFGDVFDRGECTVDRLDFEAHDIIHGPTCFLSDQEADR